MTGCDERTICPFEVVVNACKGLCKRASMIAIGRRTSFNVFVKRAALQATVVHVRFDHPLKRKAAKGHYQSKISQIIKVQILRG